MATVPFRLLPGAQPVDLKNRCRGLIKKGLIYSPEHGQIAYTVPGMADFIARQPQP